MPHRHNHTTAISAAQRRAEERLRQAQGIESAHTVPSQHAILGTSNPRSRASRIDSSNKVLRYWLLPVQGRHCIPHFAYVSAYVVTTQAEQLSARTFQRSIPCRPASEAHTMEAHRACDAVHWRVAPTGHARAARKKRTRLSKMAKNGIFGHSTDNFSASRPSTPLFYWRVQVLRWQRTCWRSLHKM